MTSTSQPLVWFITGSSVGLGAALAIHALKSGHKVIATARNPTKSTYYSEITSLGGHWITLDVTSPDSGKILTDAFKIYGRIDVLVNNAGYSILGAVEDISEEEAQSQLATNFFAPLRLIRHSLPPFRSQGSGTIVNITSIAGIDGLPTSGLYAASKFALEGLSESLAREVSPFGIRVLLVEPGAFRTNFLSSTSKLSTEKEMNDAYKGTMVESTLKKFEEMDGRQRGDVGKGVAVIFDVVTRGGIAEGMVKRGGGEEWLRLPLGFDCVQRWEAKVNNMSQNLDAVRGFVTGLDVEE